MDWGHGLGCGLPGGLAGGLVRGVARGVAKGMAGVWVGARPEAWQQDMTRCVNWGRGLSALPGCEGTWGVEAWAGCEDLGHGLMAWTGDVAWTWSERPGGVT